MNIKKQLALAQLDQLEQQDAQRQNAEAMQLLQLMLGAKQNEDAGRRADAGIDLESQRFAEAQRQFGVTTDESRANRQSDIDWRQSRAKTEDTRYADTVQREDERAYDVANRNSANDWESRRRFELEQTDKAAALKQAAAAQQLAALVQSGAPTEQILSVLRQQNPAMFPASLTPTKAVPQGGVMTEEMLKQKQAEARLEENTRNSASALARKHQGAFQYYLGTMPKDIVKKSWNFVVPESMSVKTEEDLWRAYMLEMAKTQLITK